MFSLAKHCIDALVEENISGAETVAALKSDPHRLLVTILVGNNIVNIRDLVREQNYGEGSASLTDLVHPTLHVPESKSVGELLQKMQHERMQMAVVTDEFGTTEGLITVEDMIEEIVGEILEVDVGEEITFEGEPSTLNGSITPVSSVCKPLRTAKSPTWSEGRQYRRRSEVG